MKRWYVILLLRFTCFQVKTKNTLPVNNQEEGFWYYKQLLYGDKTMNKEFMTYLSQKSIECIVENLFANH